MGHITFIALGAFQFRVAHLTIRRWIAAVSGFAVMAKLRYGIGLAFAPICRLCAAELATLRLMRPPPGAQPSVLLSQCSQRALIEMARARARPMQS